jgi:hypothetical protein
LTLLGGLSADLCDPQPRSYPVLLRNFPWAPSAPNSILGEKWEKSSPPSSLPKTANSDLESVYVVVVGSCSAVWLSPHPRVHTLKLPGARARHRAGLCPVFTGLRGSGSRLPGSTQEIIPTREGGRNRTLHKSRGPGCSASQDGASLRVPKVVCRESCLGSAQIRYPTPGQGSPSRFLPLLPNPCTPRVLSSVPPARPAPRVTTYLPAGGGSAGSGAHLRDGPARRGGGRRGAGGGGGSGRHGPQPSAPLSARPPPAAREPLGSPPRALPSGPRHPRPRRRAPLGRPSRGQPRADGPGCPFLFLSRRGAATICRDARPLLPTHPAPAPVS